MFTYSTIIVIIVLLTAQQLVSQTLPVTDSLENVTVSANKFPQKLNSIGMVVQVIQRSTILNNLSKSISQLLTEQAGIQINGAYSALGTVPSVYVRGASTGRTLFLLDGIPLYDPANIDNQFNLNFIALDQVERIEVYKGSQSTLYGSDAIAGVINIITLKPNVSSPTKLDLFSSYGSLNAGQANLDFYGRLKKFSYQVKSNFIHTDGFSTARDTAKLNRFFDNDPFSGNMNSLQLQYQFTPKFSIRSFVHNYGFKTGLDLGSFSDLRDYYSTNGLLVTGLSASYQSSKIKWKINYQFADGNQLFRKDSTKVGSLFYQNFNYQSQFHLLDGFVSFPIGSRVQLLIGTETRFNRMNQDFYSISAYGPYSSKIGDTSISQTAIYTVIQYAAPRKKFFLEGGYRATQDSRYGFNNTGAISFTYHTSLNTRIFSNISSGYKAPSLYQLYSPSGNPNLLPEKSINTEFGFQLHFSKIQQRYVLFYREIYDGLDYNYSTYKYYNFGKQNVYGFEFEHQWEISKRVVLIANYTGLWGSEFVQSRVTNKDTTYNYLLKRPNTSINVNGQFKLHKKWYLSIVGRFVGERYDVGGYKKNDLVLDPYIIFNANLRWQAKENIRMYLDVQNLFDQKFYETNGYNSIPRLINVGILINVL